MIKYKVKVSRQTCYVNYIFLTWCATTTEIKTSLLRVNKKNLKDRWFPLKKRKPQFRSQFPWETFADHCPISRNFTAPHRPIGWSEGPASLLPKLHTLFLLWDLPHCIMISYFHGGFYPVDCEVFETKVYLFGKFIYSQILAHGKNWINELSDPANCYS